MTGIELDAATASLARERHPEVTVVHGDLQRAGDTLAGPFDLVYSMTAIYAVPNHSAAFRELGALAAPGAELRLLEYADPHGRFAAETRGNASWGWWNPLSPQGVPDILATAGWSAVETRELHPEFVRWYRDLCSRIRREAAGDRRRVRRRLVRVRGARVRRHPRTDPRRHARWRSGPGTSRPRLS